MHRRVMFLGLVSNGGSGKAVNNSTQSSTMPTRRYSHAPCVADTEGIPNRGFCSADTVVPRLRMPPRSAGLSGLPMNHNRVPLPPPLLPGNATLHGGTCYLYGR